MLPVNQRVKSSAFNAFKEIFSKLDDQSQLHTSMFKTKFNREGFSPMVQKTFERKTTLKVESKMRKGDDRRMGLKYGLGFGPTGNLTKGPFANQMTVFNVESHTQ